MNHETFTTTDFVDDVGNKNNSGISFIDLMKQDIHRKADPSSYNPFLLPEITLVDSKKEDSSGIKMLRGDSAKPPNDGPAEPPSDYTKPADGTTGQAKSNDPLPTKEDVPSLHKNGDPCLPKNELPSQKGPEPPAQQKPDGSGAKTESWGRFGRQFPCDITGDAVYEVRKGDTYSAVARDVLEKRNGRVYDVKNATDRDEILKYARELADLNGVTWGKNNFVLIRPGDKIRIPAAQKSGSAPEKPVDANPPEQKMPPSVAHEANHSGLRRLAEGLKLAEPKRQEPSVMAGAFSIQPQDKFYSLLQPPGLEGQPGQSWTDDLKVKGKAHEIEYRSLESSQVFPNGDRQFLYSGEVDTGWKSGTKFQAAEVVDAQGRIVARKIAYAEPIEIRLNAPSSQNEKVKVMAIHARFDERTGRYEARYQAKDGQFFSAQYSGDGSVALDVNDRR